MIYRSRVYPPNIVGFRRYIPPLMVLLAHLLPIRAPVLPQVAVSQRDHCHEMRRAAKKGVLNSQNNPMARHSQQVHKHRLNDWALILQPVDNKHPKHYIFRISRRLVVGFVFTAVVPDEKPRSTVHTVRHDKGVFQPMLSVVRHATVEHGKSHVVRGSDAVHNNITRDRKRIVRSTATHGAHGGHYLDRRLSFDRNQGVADFDVNAGSRVAFQKVDFSLYR